ncbi:MAG: hypothetical protein LBO78_00735 [Rickettsiales bacterium]|jgi:hypothetical protein|nr:hypothetical protein [Rickettsiales bacterium]
MKKIFAYLMVSFVLFSNLAGAQVRRTGGGTRSRGNGYKLSDDAKERIRIGCQEKMKTAKAKKDTKLVPMCLVSLIQVSEADLGPWKKFVDGLVRVFQQFRRLIYVAAVFTILWILAKAAYEGEMHWEHIGILVVGVVLVALAETFIKLATNEVTLDDIKSGDKYVDCRKPEEPLYKCSVEMDGASDHDERYLFRYAGEESSVSRGGLF